MTEKVYKDVLPCGVLTTRTGEKYWLIKPEPVVRDSWQYDRQQRFLVVPYDELAVDYKIRTNNDEPTFFYGYARHLITTDPDIEYRYETATIKVWDLQEWDVVEEPLNPDSIYPSTGEPNYDYDTLEHLNVLAEQVND